MFDVDAWHEVFGTLRRNKLRTVLTACGVFWGIFMLVMMLGFGELLQHSVTRSLLGFANNNVYIWGQRTTKPFQGMKPGRQVRLTESDAEVLRRELASASVVAPRNQLGGWQDGNNVTHGSKTGNFGVMGDTPDVTLVDAVNLTRGRFLNHLDMRDRRKVTVIGEHVRQVLFEAGADPIGEQVKIRGAHFQVVGVHRSDRPGETGERENNTLYVPFSTFQITFHNADRVGWFAISGEPEVAAEALEEKARSVLGRQHDVHPEDANAIGSYNAGEKYARMERLFAGIRFFIWFVSTMTLAAGALGVSNIMLISVKERTKEIGVRKALGATPRQVVVMVMREAFVLTALAGYLGLTVGVFVLEAIGKLLRETNSELTAPAIDVAVALIAALVLSIVGVLAGMAPARHAARIRPVVALRAE